MRLSKDEIRRLHEAAIRQFFSEQRESTLATKPTWDPIPIDRLILKYLGISAD